MTSLSQAQIEALEILARGELVQFSGYWAHLRDAKSHPEFWGQRPTPIPCVHRRTISALVRRGLVALSKKNAREAVASLTQKGQQAVEGFKDAPYSASSQASSEARH